MRAYGLLAAGTCLSAAGCGELLVNLGMVPPEKVQAEFTLTTGRLLTLVDDDREFLTWPSARDVLVDDIARNLKDSKVRTQVLDSNELRALRQADKDYDTRSITDLAEKAGADQVLWIQIVDFHASGAIEETRGASRCTVRVKVFDPRAPTRARMRLWPETRDGHFLTVTEDASVLHLQQTDEQIARALIEKLAADIARLFYEHRKELR
jgi:hypothetical protein